jgi:uncharacterized membrane protein
MAEEKKRFYFIDQFRGWAVVFMVETHVVNVDHVGLHHEHHGPAAELVDKIEPLLFFGHRLPVCNSRPK